jgi:hypothetical protein
MEYCELSTVQSMSSGTVARVVKRPTIRSVPHTISTTPTNGPENCGAGMPIFAKRPAPKEAGKRNFWIPSERKTQPTRMRTSSVPEEKRR